MKELKILALLIGLTLVTYMGIEPIAHAVMHPHMEGPDFKYQDLKEIPGKGDVSRGRELTQMNCTYCHSIKADGFPKPVTKEDLIAKYGRSIEKSLSIQRNFDMISNRYLSEMYTAAVPLDLSNVASVFNEKYLKHFIKDPAGTAFESTFILHKTKQMHLDIAKAKSEEQIEAIEATTAKDISTFKAKNKISMPPQSHLTGENINDIVAYLKSVSKPIDGRESLALACGRCHGVAYDKLEATTPSEILNKYLGLVPPDLSMSIRSKGPEYLTIFLNDPQKVLIGSSMPRVGINEVTEGKIVSYLESVGDSKKDDRESLGLWVILYMTIFSVLAYLWKRKIWKEVK